jgi:hypothetical protein
MKGLTIAAAVAVAAVTAPAKAAEGLGDIKACYSESEYRQEISCTQLTEDLLFRLRFATIDEVQKVMNAYGQDATYRKELDGVGRRLHFLGYYGYRENILAHLPQKGGTGEITFVFDKDGKAVIISGMINTSDLSLPSFMYIWNAKLEPAGCFDAPNSHLRHC